MSAQYDAYGNPASVGDPGRGDEAYDPVGIAQTVNDVRTLALFAMLQQRLQLAVFVATPAAGAEFTATVPPNAAWELLSVSAVLTTSAVVANRRPILTIKDAGGNTVQRIDATTTLAASNTGRLVWSAGLGVNYNGSTLLQPLPSPPAILPGGWTLSTTTALIDTGDAYSGVILTVREWTVGQVYWQADLLGRELGFEALTDLPATTPLPVETGQPIPVSPIAR